MALSLAVLNAISPCHFCSTLLDSFCYVEFFAGSKCFSWLNWQLHAFLKQRFHPLSVICIIYDLYSTNSWSQYDDLSILNLTFPKDLETMIGTLSQVESWIAFSFAVQMLLGLYYFCSSSILRLWSCQD